MKVILNINPIKMPLTGIGRYTLELGRALERSGRLEDLKLWQGNGLVDGWPDLAASNFLELPWGERMKKKLLSEMPGGRLAIKIYFALGQQRMRRRLSGHRGYLYHSPNFYLPPFDGPKVVTVHDISSVRLPDCCPAYRRRLMDVALEQVRKRADLIVTVSEFSRQEIIAYLNWPPDKIKATPVAAAEIFQPRSEDELAAPLAQLGLKPGAYSLFVGTVEPRKNIEILLDAYEKLPETLRSRFPLVISGFEGWSGYGLYARLKKLTERGELRYLGFVPEEKMPFLMSGAALFLFPSLYEGFGLPPLEAMQSGVPVIVSNRASLPEVVGQAAAILPPNDVDAWAMAIERGLEDRAWREAMITAGLKQAGNFSWNRCALDTLAAYKEAGA